MGYFYTMMFIFILGGASIICSAVASRTQNQILHIIAWVTLGLNVILFISIYELLEWYVREQLTLMILLLLALLIIPIIFQIQYLQKIQPKSKDIASGNTSFDGATADGKVTEDFLDKVINSEEEDIDFDDEYDLR